MHRWQSDRGLDNWISKFEALDYVDIKARQAVMLIEILLYRYCVAQGHRRGWEDGRVQVYSSELALYLVYIVDIHCICIFFFSPLFL